MTITSTEIYCQCGNPSSPISTFREVGSHAFFCNHCGKAIPCQICDKDNLQVALYAESGQYKCEKHLEQVQRFPDIGYCFLENATKKAFWAGKEKP